MAKGTTFSILLVDDDQDDRMIIDEAFKEIGYESEVKKFINGTGLLQYLENIAPGLYPSLIVLDNTLPDWDAAALLLKLKENRAYQSIPVVVYTTALTPSKKEQLLSKGAYRCYEKGHSMPEIVALVKELREMAEAKQ